MIRCLACWMIALCVSGADLTFSTTSLDLTPEVGAATAVAEYPCRNTSSEPVQVGLVEGGCSCLSWQLTIGGVPATEIPAGGTGIISLRIGLRGGSGGKQWKSATFIGTGVHGEEKYTLSFSYDTGTAIQLTRKTLYWDLEEALQAKVSTLIVQPSESPIRITGVRSKNADFTVEFVTLEEGRRYEIHATPRTTSMDLIGSVIIDTDSPLEAWQSFSIFLLVSQVQH